MGSSSAEPLCVSTAHQGIETAASLFGEYRKQVNATWLSHLFQSLVLTATEVKK